MQITGLPVAFSVVAKFRVPQSYSQKRQKEMHGQPHDLRPDGDNTLKLCLDSLNGIAWLDDKQVYDMRIVKLWDYYEDSLDITIVIGRPVHRL